MGTTMVIHVLRFSQKPIKHVSAFFFTDDQGENSTQTHGKSSAFHAEIR